MAFKLALFILGFGLIVPSAAYLSLEIAGVEGFNESVIGARYLRDIKFANASQY